MKKNVMMRLASFLLVAVLISTSAISGTYAKYVTSDTATDDARVAKWGVTASITGSLFDKNYKDAPEIDANKMTVVSSDSSKNVVAPGTENNTGLTITLTGKPEVDVAIVFSMTATSEINMIAGTYDDPTNAEVDNSLVLDAPYYPVVFTLKDNKDNVLATGNVEAIQTYLSSLSQTYQANTELKDITGNDGADGTYTLTWKWDFNGNNAADTYLGNAAVTTAEGATTEMNVTFSVSATQID